MNEERESNDEGEKKWRENKKWESWGIRKMQASSQVTARHEMRWDETKERKELPFFWQLSSLHIPSILLSSSLSLPFTLFSSFHFVLFVFLLITRSLAGNETWTEPGESGVKIVFILSLHDLVSSKDKRMQRERERNEMREREKRNEWEREDVEKKVMADGMRGADVSQWVEERKERGLIDGATVKLSKNGGKEEGQNPWIIARGGSQAHLETIAKAASETNTFTISREREGNRERERMTKKQGERRDGERKLLSLAQQIILLCSCSLWPNLFSCFSSLSFSFYFQIFSLSGLFLIDRYLYIILYLKRTRKDDSWSVKKGNQRKTERNEKVGRKEKWGRRKIERRGKEDRKKRKGR